MTAGPVADVVFFGCVVVVVGAMVVVVVDDEEPFGVVVVELGCVVDVEDDEFGTVVVEDPFGEDPAGELPVPEAPDCKVLRFNEAALEWNVSSPANPARVPVTTSGVRFMWLGASLVEERRYEKALVSCPLSQLAGAVA